MAGTAEGSLLHLTKSKTHAIHQISCINIARAGDAEAIPGYHRGSWPAGLVSPDG